MAENYFKILENDEELQALQDICTKGVKNKLIQAFKKKILKIAVSDMLKEKQTQSNNVLKSREATLATNTMLTAENEEASKSYNNMVLSIENVRTANTSYMKDLILTTAESTSKITTRFENDKNMCEELVQNIKGKYDKIPVVQEWRARMNEETNIINNIKENKSSNNEIVLNLKRKQKNVAELDKLRIKALSKFMSEERPKLLRNIEKEERERDNLRKQIFENQKQNLVAQKICKLEKQPKDILLSSSQNMPSDESSTTRNLCDMWKKKYSILIEDKKSMNDVKEDLFSSSYMKYLNSQHSTFKANANKQHLIDILEDLPSEENDNKSIVPGCGINYPGSSKTKVLDYGNKIIEHMGDTATKSKLTIQDKNTSKKIKDEKVNEIKVPPKQFQDNYEIKESKTITFKNEKVNDIKGAPKQFQDIYESQEDVATKSKGEDVAMIIEVPCEEVKHSKEGKKPTEPSKLNGNDNFLTNCYMQYFSTKYNHAKGSVQKDNYINILEDVPVDDSQMETIISKLNVNTLQAVEVIKVTRPVKEPTDSAIVKENEGSGVVNITDSPILPPTMFIDSSQTDDVSNEGGITEIKTMNTQECVHEDTYDDDDSYRKKRKILLDNSPDFVYAKNSSLQKEYATSKYFTQKQIQENKGREINVDDNETQEENDKNENFMDVDTDNPKNIIQIATETIINQGGSELFILNRTGGEPVAALNGPRCVTSSTDDNNQIEDKKVVPNKIAQDEVFSPNESMNTTMDEMDSSHYIDSNLLLSPKADEEQNVKESSIFLTGIKKPEMSFFGNYQGSSSDANKPESNTQNPGLFNFNFGGGGDGKKKSGGNLFNFFN